MTLSRLTAAAALVGISGCDSTLGPDGNPRLCRRELANGSLKYEIAILRVVESPGPRERLLLDLLRYSPHDQHNVNRVIYATTEKVRPAGQGLGVARGDTLLVSSTYTGLVRGGGYEAFVPNWVANEGRCLDRRFVSRHALLSVEKAVLTPPPPPR